MLNALTYRFGAFAQASKRVQYTRTIGILIECPECDSIMCAATAATRVCTQCGTEALLNEEEVAAIHAGLINA